MIKSDRKYALVMLLLSITYAVSAYTLDTDFDPTNEKFYPLVLSLLMILSSLVLLFFPSAHTATWPNWQNWQKIALTFSAILVYSLILHKVGFIISASVLMAICMWVFNAEKRWILPTSLITSVSFYLVFDRLLGLNLPAGLLGFL